MLKPYYIYRHIRPDTNEVFYIGKGKNRRNKYEYERANASARRTSFWRRIVDKCDGEYQIEIMMEFEDPLDCVAKEIEMIKLYGRKDKGEGTLCNLTDGGEGGYGRTYSEEQRQQRRERMSGTNHPMWGRKASVESRNKMSESHKNSPFSLSGKTLPDWWKERIRQTKFGERNPMFGKVGIQHHLSMQIRDTATGMVYYGVPDAAKAAGVTCSILYQYLDGTRINKTTMVKEPRDASSVS